MMVRFAASTLLAVLAYGQSFEVASVKPAVMPAYAQGFWVGSSSGGPRTADPTRYSCDKCDLYNLVLMAYDLHAYQLSVPDWMRSAGFDIAAKMPEGTTEEQFRLMLQHLLTERFKLAMHRERKEMPAYELTVAKGGPKLKESPGAAPPSTAEPAKFTLDKEGFPVLAPGQPFSMIVTNDRARLRAAGMSMEDFARRLSGQTNRPVIDATGLKGKYDFTLSWVGNAISPNPTAIENSGPTLPGALQEQLGLRLESKKGSVEILVVDHMEKTPAEN